MGEVDGADYIGFYKNHGFTGFPEEIHWNIISRGWHESFFSLRNALPARTVEIDLNGTSTGECGNSVSPRKCSWAPKSLQMVTAVTKLKDAYSLEE